MPIETQSKVNMCPSYERSARVPLSAEELGQLAPTPEAQFRHFQAAVERFEDDPSFENADLFCFNARFDWASIPLARTPEDKPRMLARVSAYLEQVNRGLSLLKGLQPENEEQEQIKAMGLRVCNKRREWAELLLTTGDVARVESAEWAYGQESVDLSEAG